MDSTYAWHPGAGCVKPRWAIPVPLLPDEIISSWLVRAALAHGCDPLVLTGKIWPKWRVWTLDIDRRLPDERIKPLALVAGIPPMAFKKATLQPTANSVHGDIKPNMAVWPWMLALGARNIKRRGGLQYCPICLSDDAKPYYRVQWRFAWQIACERHGCCLLDRCWKCNAPVEPHRLAAQDGQAATCATCKADFRLAKAQSCMADALAFQRETDRILHDGNGFCFEQNVSVKDWFSLADFLTSLIRRANRGGTDGLTHLIADMGAALPLDTPALGITAVEMLRTDERQIALSASWRFIASGRNRLIAALADSGITRQGFLGGAKIIPTLFVELIKALPEDPIDRTKRSKRRRTSPRLKHEVVRMMATLERQMKTAPR